MIYFDNAATTFPKPKCVLKEVDECLKKYCGNPGRSSHRLSVKTSEKIYETREKTASFIGCDSPENIVFTQNATYALNIAIKTLLSENSHALVSNMEHNSVIRPLHAMKKACGVEYSVFDFSADIENELPKHLKDNTECVICTLASNVTGKTVDFKKLSEFCVQQNLKLIVDASQYIGHKKIDIKSTPCDALCAPGHKALFGIQGAGFLYFGTSDFKRSLIEGGSGNESEKLDMPENLPERIEAGTLPSPSVISILSGINFIEKSTLSAIEEKNKLLTDKCIDRITSINGIVFYGGENGVLSFNLADIPAYVISDELNKSGICTRSGLHCAPLAHRCIGTPRSGSVRVSFSYLNKFSELDRFYKELCSICKKYK